MGHSLRNAGDRQGIDDIEENEFIGEDTGPTEHPMAFSTAAKVAAFIAETQQSLGTSDRELLGRAKVSPHSLKRLRAGKRVGDDPPAPFGERRGTIAPGTWTGNRGKGKVAADSEGADDKDGRS